MKRNLLILVLGCILGLYQPLNAQDAENVVNGHEYVDLALPSGLKWATCNVGASKPEACGSYFAWGETKLKDGYAPGNNLTYVKEIDDISGNVQYDVAAANWGEGWRMPTKDEMQELIDNCDWEWTKQNNVKGYKVTGENGNSIFIPETGNWEGSTFYSGSCEYSYYWSSSPYDNSNACYLYFNSSSHNVNYSYRYRGRSVRPVRDREDVIEAPFVAAMVEHYTDLMAIIKTYVTSPGAAITERGFYYGTNPEPAETDNKVVMENGVGYITKALLDLTPNTTYYVKAYATNREGTSYSEVVSFTTLEKIEYEYVDLGLPSGLKWAAYNIGASSPSEYGNYYAWGEVETKEKYTKENSLTYGKYMEDISGDNQFDAATFNWGGNWRMPTEEEMKEMVSMCVWEWTMQNQVYGYKLTSKINGNSIFLPAAGGREDDEYTDYKEGEEAIYLTSTPWYDGTNYLYFSRSTYLVKGYAYGRYMGYVIRPVLDVLSDAIVTLSVENYTNMTAVVKTYVSSSYEITERGFYYGTNPEPAETDNKVVLENGVGYITKALLDLTPNTTYYVKAYATNSEGTSYSEVVSFTTLENPKEYEYVDLGLPSGLKWATHNIGATTPEEYGNYYAWGEVLTKETYTEANSETYGKSMSGISGTEYDAATVNWGDEWRMPTYDEMNELINNCTWTWTTQNGVNGYKVASKVNSNSIFLPAAGYRSGALLNSAGDYGYYLSSDLNGTNYFYSLYFLASSRSVGNSDRSTGHTVRPVLDKVTSPTVVASVENYTDLTSIIKTYVSSSAEITERGFYWGTNSEPSEADNKVVIENEVGYKASALMNLTPNTTYYVKAYATNSEGTSYSEVVSFTTLETPVEYEYVDLGLPSGLKWATHNIGATTAEEYGNYYAWGEVVTKETYTQANSETYGKEMSDISGTEYDAATVNWGDEWRMPTYGEMKELINNCTWTWTTQNGVNGYKVTSKTNGNSIFLPAAGCRDGASLYNEGHSGNYWSSTPIGNSNVYYLYFTSSGCSVGGVYRGDGLTVRPVRE